LLPAGPARDGWADRAMNLGLLSRPRVVGMRVRVSVRVRMRVRVSVWVRAPAVRVRCV